MFYIGQCLASTVEYIQGNCYCSYCVLEFHELNHPFTQLKRLASQTCMFSQGSYFGFVLTASSGVGPEHRMLTSRTV